MKKQIDNKTFWRYGIVHDFDEDKSYFAEVYLRNGKVRFCLPVGVLQIIKNFRMFIKDIKLQKKSNFRIYFSNRKFYSRVLN